MTTEDIKKAMRAKPKKRSLDLSPKNLLGTGSTLLNLATSGNPRGGLVKGGYFFFVGDSSSGKTFLTLTCFAEAARNPNFKDYRFIFDDVEGGALMDFEKYFGKAVAERVEPPQGTIDDPQYSEGIEDFYFNVDDALTRAESDKTPFIYVLDSMDGLSSDYEGSKFQEKKKAARTGTKAKGDYGDGKAKINSSGLRACLSRLRDTGSILIIINQTRDNVGGGLFDPKKIRSGGHALTFYAQLEIWSSMAGKIKRTVKGKERVLGVNSRLTVKKNRLSGKITTVEIPIFYEYGIDDTMSCIEFMVSEGPWKKQGAKIAAEIGGEEFVLSPVGLARAIEEKELTLELQLMVHEAWDSIQEACSMKRKPRYE